MYLVVTFLQGLNTGVNFLFTESSIHINHIKEIVVIFSGTIASKHSCLGLDVYPKMNLGFKHICQDNHFLHC